MSTLRDDIRHALGQEQEGLGDVGGARQRLVENAKASLEVTHRPLNWASGVAAALLAVLVIATLLYVRAGSHPGFPPATTPHATASPNQEAGASTYRIASAPTKSDIILTARREGVLHGQSNADGTACFWLGQTSDGAALSWPYGFTGGGNPLSVYDDSGQRVASVGQYVILAGGLMPDSVHSILGCHDFSTYWAVGKVIQTRSS